MFSWLRRLWPRGQRRDPDCFYFSDGTRERLVDPLAVLQEIEQECPDYADLFAVLADDTPAIAGPVGESLKQQKTDALNRLVAVARKVFGLSPKEQAAAGETGLTNAAAFRVLGSWLVWMREAGDQARPFFGSRQRASPLTSPDSPGEPSAACTTSEPRSPAKEPTPTPTPL